MLCYWKESPPNEVNVDSHAQERASYKVRIHQRRAKARGSCTTVDTTGRLDHALAFRFILNIIGRFQIIVIWGKEGDQICSNMDNEPHGFVNDSVDTVNLGSTRDSKIGKQRVLS